MVVKSFPDQNRAVAKDGMEMLGLRHESMCLRCGVGAWPVTWGHGIVNIIIFIYTWLQASGT